MELLEWPGHRRGCDEWRTCTERQCRAYRHGRLENLRNVGCTLEMYDELIQDQLGCCAICDTYCGDSLCVDHDHATGRVRGLLCTPCNLGLGNFDDSIESLAGAIAYLARGVTTKKP